MLSNLNAELARGNISRKELMQLLGCARKTIENKISGRSEFSIAEAFKIVNTFFPGADIPYLFAKQNDHAAS